METGALVELPESQFNRHSDFNLVWIPVRQLAVNPSPALQIGDSQNIGKIEGKDRPFVKTVGEQLSLLV